MFWLYVINQQIKCKDSSFVCFRPGTEKLIPKNPIMRWNDDLESPGVAPPDMHQYPFSGQSGSGTPRGSDIDSSFRSDRYPFQPRENTQYGQDPYPGQGYRNDNGAPGPYPHDNYSQGQGYDPRYPGDRSDSMRGSQRSSQSQNLPDDQRSMSNMSQRSNQPSFSTLPRDMRPNQLDVSMRSQGSSRGQGYNSLPRDPRSMLSPGESPPYGHSSPRQQQQNMGGHRGHPGQGQDGQGQRKNDDNPYMMMVSPQLNSERSVCLCSHFFLK